MRARPRLLTRFVHTFAGSHCLRVGRGIISIRSPCSCVHAWQKHLCLEVLIEFQGTQRSTNRVCIRARISRDAFLEPEPRERFFSYIRFPGTGVSGLFVAATEHDHADEQTSPKKHEAKHVMCSGNHCHEDANCMAIGPGHRECKCNGDLIGDGVTACHRPRGPNERFQHH